MAGRRRSGRPRPAWVCTPWAAAFGICITSVSLLYAAAVPVSHRPGAPAHTFHLKERCPPCQNRSHGPCAPCRNGHSVPGHGWWPPCCAASALQGWPRGWHICNYLRAAGTPAVRWASNCGTPWCPPTGAASTVRTARCWPPTAAAGLCGPPRVKCRKKSFALPQTALRRSWSWTKPHWKSSATAAPTTACCATVWSGTPPTGCGTSAKQTASPASASIRTPNAGIRRGSFWQVCWVLPT